ncbi:MAG TPA: 3-deoxy-manno-octulosonate-8-phosphatase KdsC [Leucothrix mucor]|nr:3-deoxy-manno-octulosonate-8-phosphatase KdsC [Leucothrix mucor]
MTPLVIKKAPDIAKHIKLIIFDVDGVLTDGSLFYDNNGEEYKAFNAKDGHGLRMLQKANIDVAIITGRKSKLVQHRAENLNLSPNMIYQGYSDKRIAYKDLLEKTNLSPQQVAYVGDDIIDLPVMTRVGLAIAVQDAHWFVIRHADWVSQQKGGHGAVREICEMLLEAQGKLEVLLESYLK